MLMNWRRRRAASRQGDEMVPPQGLTDVTSQNSDSVRFRQKLDPCLHLSFQRLLQNTVLLRNPDMVRIVSADQETIIIVWSFGQLLQFGEHQDFNSLLKGNRLISDSEVNFIENPDILKVALQECQQQKTKVSHWKIKWIVWIDYILPIRI